MWLLVRARLVYPVVAGVTFSGTPYHRHRVSCTPPSGGPKDAPRTDQHDVFEDILRFERRGIRDMGKHLMREQHKRRECAHHVQEQERQR